MAEGKGELAVEISPARLLGVLAHILTRQLHCAVGGHSCISHAAEAQDCSATPPPSTSTSPPDTSSRCLCQTVCCQAPPDPHQQPGQSTQCTSRLPHGWQHMVVGTRTRHSLAGKGITSLVIKPVAMPTSLLQWCSVCQKTEGCNVD